MGRPGYPASPCEPASGVTALGPRLVRFLIGSGRRAPARRAPPSAAFRARAALRSAFVYWFQWALHIRPRPSFWLGWAGKSAAGASCASIPNFADPMHLRMSAMSFVLSLADADLASGRTSITLSARRCKAEHGGRLHDRRTAPTTAWRNRITGSGEEAPDQLLANPANWRIHPKAQQDALAGALDAVGWVQQVLVNRRTGFVVDGHARVALALSRGEPTVPVLYVDLAPDEEALVLATLDPIGAMAGRDDEKLKALLADVTVDDAGLLALLGDLGGSEPKAGLTDPDEVPEPPEEPYVKPGEL